MDGHAQLLRVEERRGGFDRLLRLHVLFVAAGASGKGCLLDCKETTTESCTEFESRVKETRSRPYVRNENIGGGLDE